VAQGPAAWLDTHLTTAVMTPLFAGAGSGPKITARFKAKVFSFAQVVVDENKFTLFQITEPLQSTSSATPANSAPFGTDADGRPLNDPIPDTLVDPTTGSVVSPPGAGVPALLDEFSVTKPDLESRLLATVSGPVRVAAGTTATVQVDVGNRSRVALNGAQVVFALPEGTDFAGTLDDHTTLHGREVVFTLGRLAQGARASVRVPLTATGEPEVGVLAARAVLRSSTARSVLARPAFSGRP
jgi:hypothetical protein